MESGAILGRQSYSFWDFSLIRMGITERTQSLDADAKISHTDAKPSVSIEDIWLDDLRKWKYNAPLTICVIGTCGSGKSYFINALRGIYQVRKPQFVSLDMRRRCGDCAAGKQISKDPHVVDYAERWTENSEEISEILEHSIGNSEEISAIRKLTVRGYIAQGTNFIKAQKKVLNKERTTTSSTKRRRNVMKTKQITELAKTINISLARAYTKIPESLKEAPRYSREGSDNDSHSLDGFAEKWLDSTEPLALVLINGVLLHNPNIALVGSTGAGKSSFINSIRDTSVVIDGDPHCFPLDMLWRYDDCAAVEQIPKVLHVVDHAGLWTDNSEKIREILDLLIGGRILPATKFEDLSKVWSKERITTSSMEHSKSKPLTLVSGRSMRVSNKIPGSFKEAPRYSREEIEEMERINRCKICLDDDACIVFLPCCHMVACEICASVLKRCAVCRSLICDTLKVNLQ